ncbi:DnaJ subfamily C member 13, partial [Cichlidogyrus casuarinus]
NHKAVQDERPITLRKPRTQLGRVRRIWQYQQQKKQQLEDCESLSSVLPTAKTYDPDHSRSQSVSSAQGTVTTGSNPDLVETVNGLAESSKDTRDSDSLAEANFSTYRVIHSKELNWPMFFFQFGEDHAKPDLIWNVRTREELRITLEKEIAEFNRERDYFHQSHMEQNNTSHLLQPNSKTPNAEGNVNGTYNAPYASTGEEESYSTVPLGQHPPAPEQNKAEMTVAKKMNATEKLTATVDFIITQAGLVSWNHDEFSISYVSLMGEPKVGNYYLRLLLEEDKRSCSQSSDLEPIGLSRIRDSVSFFNELFRRYLQYAAAGPAIPNISNLPGITSSASGALNFTASAAASERIGREQARRKYRLAMRCMCLHAMAIVYGRCFREIGPVTDMPLLVHTLDKTVSAAEPPTALQKQTMTIKASSNQETNESGASTQKEWWYTKQAESTKLESQGPISLTDLRKMFEDGTLAYSTKIYAQGLDTTPRCRVDGAFADSNSDVEEGHSFSGFESNSFNCCMSLIDSSFASTAQRVDNATGWAKASNVCQLRWSITQVLHKSTKVASGDPNKCEVALKDPEKPSDLADKLGYSKGALLDHTNMAIRCVEILQKLCKSCSSRDINGGIVRPLPKPRKVLSSLQHLPHLVQLLITFDPPLVDRIVSVLHTLMDQSPLLPRLYLTGAFYFILMYTGSNVLPIARFLKATHLQQAFRQDQVFGSDLASRSILGNILPDAMISYLENYNPEKFAEIFLGDFDTPEAIWSGEMRRYMIERLAAHLSEYTPRLQSNVRALYSFIPIPVIRYPQLEEELFCHNYYLRHLCDMQRFPDWPIRDPVSSP